MRLKALFLPSLIVVAGGFLALCKAKTETAQPLGDAPTAWSETVDGLRGRLVITAVNNQGKPNMVRSDGGKTFRVYIELQNVSYTYKTVAIWSPYYDGNKEYAMLLTDSKEEPVARAKGIFGYDLANGVRWIELPVDSTFRFPITSGFFEIQQPGGELITSLEADKPWLLSSDKSRRYFLSCIFKPMEAEKFAQKIGSKPLDGRYVYEMWRGTLCLPRVAIPTDK